MKHESFLLLDCSAQPGECLKLKSPSEPSFLLWLSLLSAALSTVETADSQLSEEQLACCRAAVETAESEPGTAVQSQSKCSRGAEVTVRLAAVGRGVLVVRSTDLTASLSDRQLLASYSCLKKCTYHSKNLVAGENGMESIGYNSPEQRSLGRDPSPSQGPR